MAEHQAVHEIRADETLALRARIEELKAENKKLRTELDWAKYCYDDLRAALEKKND
jgi:cell division protein FtsB